MSIDVKKLEDYLDNFYKPNLQAILSDESYKWRVMHNFKSVDFLSGGFADPELFRVRFIDAINSLENLLNGQKYYASQCLIDCAKAFPIETKKALSDLNYAGYSGNVIEGMNSFNATMQDLTSRVKAKDFYKDSFKDYRASALLLFLMYPEKYYFYKSDEYKNIKKIIEYKPNIDLSDYENCQLMSQEILEYIKTDSELLSEFIKTTYEYSRIDPENHLIVQDILWSTRYYLDPRKIPGKHSEQDWDVEEIPYPNFTFPDTDISKQKSGKIDYEGIAKKNAELGLAGELFVMRYETWRLQKLFPNENKLPTHVSIDEGDGKGYDIRSFDIDGVTPIYIEVKTTEGPYEQAFYLSWNEMEFSDDKLFKKQYRLYRVYDFKNGKGKIGITQGSLAKYCQRPTEYKVILKKPK